MRILFGKFLNNTRPGKMLGRIKCFIFLLVLQCPPSLLIPLAQEDADSTSEANDALVLESIEQTFPNISEVTDLIQQIDVKDVANQVISNINDVVVGGESIDTIIPELHNRVANKKQSDALHTTGKVTNTLINEINTVSNDTEIYANVTSDWVLNSTENLTSLNNNESIDLAEENDGNGVHTEEPLTLKPSSDTRNTIIDVKFRRSGSQNQENNSDDVNKDVAVNNDSLESSPADNGSLANSNDTAVEKPAFRMLLQDKLRKLKQVSNIVTETNDNKDLNFVLKLLPEIQQNIDLNQLPLNNLVAGALNFMKRFKRDKKGNYPWNSNCTFKKIDGRKVRTCKETKELTVSTRRSLLENTSKVLKLYNPNYLLCPLSVVLKIIAQQVLDRTINSVSDGLLKQILTSFLKGEENTINLVTKEIPYLPISVNISLQLVHGKTKDFIGLIGDYIDATLCAL